MESPSRGIDEAMKRNLFILYVTEQERSAAFYEAVLGCSPVLNVPGMTEFSLGPASSLGLMPEHGIKSLLGDALPNPASAAGIPRAELYLRVENAALQHTHALAVGATELSPLMARPWGDQVAYSLDPDGHVLALAQA